MATDDRQQEEPQEQEEKASPPQQQEGSSLAKAVEEITRLRQEQAQRDRYLYQQAMQAQQQRAEPKPEPEEDLEDLDPAVRKYIERTEQRFSQQFQQELSRRDQMIMERSAEMEREKLLTELRAAGREGDIAEVDRFMDDQQVPLHLRAARGSYQQAFYNLLGAKAAKDVLRKPAPTPAPARAAQEMESVAPMSDFERYQVAKMNRAFGVSVEPEEAKIFDSNHVSLDDYQEYLRSKMAKENKR